MALGTRIYFYGFCSDLCMGGGGDTGSDNHDCQPSQPAGTPTGLNPL